MYNTQAKTKFIELKAAGIPIYKISNELGIHRTTLIRWNKELAQYILIKRQDIIDEILFENDCLRIDRIQAISLNLKMCYMMLEDKDTKEDKNLPPVDVILNRITKLTKLLMIESSGKSGESSMKQYPNDKNTGLEGDVLETTVWVTDKEKFTKYQPDEDVLNKSDEEFKEYVDDIKKADKENAGFRNSDFTTIQDISEKSPEIQKVFNKTIRRKYCTDKSKIVKCDQNATMFAKDS